MGRIEPRSWEGSNLDHGKDRTSITGRIEPRSWEGSSLDHGKDRASITGRIEPRSREGSSLDHGRLWRTLWVRRSAGIWRTSLRACIRRSVLIYTGGLAPKRQKPEARGGPLSYCQGPTGALNPLGGGKDRASIRGACGERYGYGGVGEYGAHPFVPASGGAGFDHRKGTDHAQGRGWYRPLFPGEVHAFSIL
jgi:hypothetical protein